MNKELEFLKMYAEKQGDESDDLEFLRDRAAYEAKRSIESAPELLSQIQSGIKTLHGKLPKHGTGYYSRPVGIDDSGAEDVKKQVESLSFTLEYCQSQLNRDERNVTQAASYLQETNEAMKKAYSAYKVSPTKKASEIYNQAVAAYQKASKDYGTAYNQYMQTFKTVERIAGGADQVYKEWNQYLADYQDVYKNWRSTIRDPGIVKQELDAIEQEISNAQRAGKGGYKTGISFVDDAVEWILDKTGMQDIATLQSGQADINYLQHKRELLQSEYDWGKLAQVTDIEGMPYFGTLSQDDRLMMIDVAEINNMTPEDRANWEHWYWSGRNGGEELTAWAEAYGIDRLAELNNSWKRYKNAEYVQKLEEKAVKSADGVWGGIWTSIAGLGENLWSSLTSIPATAQALFNYDDRYTSLDPNSPGFHASIWADAAQNKVTQNIMGDVYDENGNLVSEGGSLRDALATLYSSGMSAADNLTRLAVGLSTGGGSTVTLGLAAVSSFGDTVRKISKQGGNPMQAIAMGVINASLEVLTEKYSVENLFKIVEGDPLTGAKVLWEMLKQGGIEVTEEEVNFLASTLAEAAVMREKSSYSLRVNELMGQGMSKADAREKANWEWVGQARDTAIQSFLSGMMMTGVTGMTQKVQYGISGKKFGLNEVSLEDAQAIIDSGLESGKDTAAYKMALKLQKKLKAGKIPTAGELYQQLAANERAIQEEQKNSVADAPGNITAAKPTIGTDTGIQQELTSEQLAVIRQGADDALQAGAISQKDYDDLMRRISRQEQAVAVAEPTTEHVQIQQEQNQNGGNTNESTETGYAAEQRRQTNSTATADVAGRGSSGTDLSDGGRRWDAGTGTGEQSRGVASGTGRGQTADRTRTFAQRENRINAVRDIEASSPASFGIRNGSKNETMKLIPVGRQDETLRQIDRWFEQHGVNAYFYTGLLEIKRRDGSYFVTPGVLQGNSVFIQADNTRLTPEQIGKHEAFHLLRRENPGLVQRLVEDLKNRYTEAEFDVIVEKYIKRYGDVIDMTSEDAIWKIWEEILADAYAGIDPRNAGVIKYAEVAQEFTNRYTGERDGLQSNGTRQTNGPNSQTVGNEEPQYIIMQRTDGKRYVKADREVITGDDPDQWGRQLEYFINEKIRKGEDVIFPTEDGHFLVLTGRSAYKLSDRHKAEIANKIRPMLSDADYALKARAAGHIDELIQVAKFDRYREDLDAAHDNDIGEDGFNYFVAFFEDDDGTYYRVVFSAALNENMETAYSIGDIRRRTPHSRGSSGKNRRSKNVRSPSAPIIYTSASKSQEKTAFQIAMEKAGYTKESVDADEQSFLLEPEDLKDVPWYEPGMKGTSIGPEQIPSKIDSAKDAMQAADAMRGATQDRERPINAPKEKFEGTDHLQALGVKVENSVGDYWGIAQAVAQDKAAKQLKKQIRRAETRLAPTEAEREFAAGIAAGKYYPEDIPGRMDYDVVTELADYYQAEKSMDTHLLREKKSGIAARLQEDMQMLFKDSDAFTPSKAIILNYRTPERNMLEIFGNERGKAINDAIFSAVAVNEAERYRFMNRMFDEVRTFEDSEGKKRELTKEERAMAMILMEGDAASEIAAEMEMGGQIRNAAENIKNGADSGDAAIEWGLSSEERKLAERIAQWLQAKETMDSDNVDADIVKKAARKYGDQFNKFYDAINDFLVAHGYETIGFIRGYAPHLQPEKTQTTMKKVFHRLGIDADVAELPTNIAGMTADFKPNKRWNPHMQHRRGDKTQYDIAKAYESYVEYMSDILYHTDDIMRVRQAVNYFRRTYAPDEIKNMLEWAEELRYEKRPEQKSAFLRAHGVLDNTSILSKESIDERFNSFIDEEYKKIENAGKYSEFVKYLDNYANILAGKQSARDRGAEVNGRAEMSRGNKLVQIFGRSQVAGSISSALNQSAQLPQIIAEVGQTNVARAAWDIARGKLKKAAWAQESDFLTGKKGVDFLVTDPGEMILSGMFKPAEFVDGFISTLAVRGEYLKQIKAGKSHQEAMKLADKKGTAIMGSRMKGSKPVAFHAKNWLDSMVHVFQVEALNSWEHIAKDLPRDFSEIAAEKGKKAAAGALAGVVVKYLLAAFLLNRFAEEGYGGTPAPFDLLGLTANFIASGEGLTTNEYLCTVLDNAWEKMVGNRPFGTDATAFDETFNLGKAVEDTVYNVANDVPFLRNAAAVMGVGDSTLPIPDIGGTVVRTATNVMEGNWEKIPEEVFGLAMDFIPGGRQLEKTAQGLETVIRGGRYTGYGDNKRLQYQVEGNLGNVVGGVLFGRSGLDETGDYYASGQSALSVNQTKLYQSLVEKGADGKTLYEAIQKWRGLENNEDMNSYAKTAQQCDLIRGLDMTDDMKLEMYRDMTGAESRANKFSELLDVGLSWDQVMDAYEEYCFQDSQENLTATQKATKFKYWIDSREFTEAQAEKIADTLKFYNFVPAEAERYEKLIESGLKPDEAMELISGINGLEPIAGEDQVADVQRWRVCVDSFGVSAAQLAALASYMTDTQLKKAQAADDFGVDLSDFVRLYEIRTEYDENENGSFSNAEYKKAIDSLGLNTNDSAVLWQLVTGTKSAKNNPYSSTIGQKVLDSMDD